MDRIHSAKPSPGMRTLSALALAEYRLRWLGLALLLSLGLAGCAAPGFGTPGPMNYGDGNQGGDATASAAAGNGKIIPITPDLIRTQIA